MLEPTKLTSGVGSPFDYRVKSTTIDLNQPGGTPHKEMRAKNFPFPYEDCPRAVMGAK